MMTPQQKHLTPAQALKSLQQYCAYQERCHSEVREKLAGYSVYGKDADAVIAKLIEEDYLNEERFAIQYAGGKFRMKQWGKQKIKSALKQKRISDYSIKKALRAIDDNSYMQCLDKLAEKKKAELKTVKNIFIKKRKLRDYLLQKGYETDLINPIINNL